MLKGERIQQTLYGHTDVVWNCEISPDGHWIVSASADHSLKVWDTVNNKEVLSFPLPGTLTSLALHPWQPLVVGGDTRGGSLPARLGWKSHMGQSSSRRSTEALGLVVRCPDASVIIRSHKLTSATNSPALP